MSKINIEKQKSGRTDHGGDSKILPCGLWWADRGCFPGRRSFVFAPKNHPVLQDLRRPRIFSHGIANLAQKVCANYAMFAIPLQQFLPDLKKEGKFILNIGIYILSNSVLI